MKRDLNQAEITSEKMTRFWNSLLSGVKITWHGAGLINFILFCLAGISIGLLCLVSPFLGVAMGLGILIFVSSLSRPIILCYVVISATILTSGIERGRLIPILTINEISLLVTATITLLTVLAVKRRKIVISRYFVAAFAVLIGGTVIIPVLIYRLQDIQLNMSNAFKMFSSIQYFLLFLVFSIIPKNEVDRRKIVWFMLIFGMIVAVVGLLQGLGIGFVTGLLNNLYTSSHLSMAARAGRVTSLLGSWNTLGIFMMTIIFICWAVLFETDRLAERLLIVGILMLSVFCLIASGSYAGVIGLVIGLFLLEMFSQRRARSMPVLVIGLIGVILAIVLLYPFLQPLVEKRLTYQFRLGGFVPQTLLYRIYVWQEIFLPAIRQRFPWPVAPTIPSYFAWQFEESQYLMLLFRTGLAGFIGYLTWIGITIGWLIWSFRRSQGFDKAIASVALTLVIVLVIAGLTNEVFSFAGTIDYLWIMLALVANGLDKI
jgi:O-antigen ligase